MANEPVVRDAARAGASAVGEDGHGGGGDHAWALEALSALSDGVLIVNEHAKLVFHNDAAERLIGVKAVPSAPPEHWSFAFGFYHADGVTPFPYEELPLLKALGGEPARDVEIAVRNAATRGALLLLVSSSTLRDARGCIRGAVAIFRDVTERRRQSAQLAEGELQKKAILDNIPDMAWLKDRDGRFIAVNQPFAAAAGKERPEDLFGVTDFDLWPRDLAERYRADDEEVMSSGETKRIEEPLVDAQGAVRWIETFKTRIVGDGGEVIGTTGISRDVTERRRAEEALRMSRDELERRVVERTAELAQAQAALVRKERLAVLGQLAGGVAHQIRNPLAAIMNASYVLKRHVSPEQHPDVEDAIHIIHDEVRHANVIITGLLDFARVRSPDRHPASIAELVERVLAADWVPSCVEIERAVEDVPLLSVDADQLMGALVNLTRNAVEAMPGGGVLRVEVRAEETHVVIAVADTGIGISPQVRSRLFEPLHSTKPMGVGLGLVTARTFVEAHGGTIACVDVPRGARFEIRLPIG